MVKERRNRPAIVNIAGLFLHPLLREGYYARLRQHEQCTRGSGQQSDSASDGGNIGTGVGHRVLVAVAVAPGLLVLPGFCSSGPGATALALTVTLKVAVTPR